LQKDAALKATREPKALLEPQIELEGNGKRVCVSYLLFTVPFTASTTNAMDMNRAMTSSVDLQTQCRSDNQTVLLSD